MSRGRTIRWTRCASAGAYTYPTLTAFAQDFSGGTTRSYTNFTQQFGTSAHVVPYRELNAYAQDTWKALPRVSITAGVRWDKTFLPQPSVIAAELLQHRYDSFVRTSRSRRASAWDIW